MSKCGLCHSGKLWRSSGPLSPISRLDSNRDWAKSFDIDGISGSTLAFSAGATSLAACVGNISVTHCASFCISCLCPPPYISACKPGINHFPASLLHEMKGFIMVTVGRCEAFAVIYLGKMIDSLTLSEQCSAGGGSAAAACDRGRAEEHPERPGTSREEVLTGRPLLDSCRRLTQPCSSTHYLPVAVSSPEVWEGTLWQRTEWPLISPCICLPTR